jgi:nucleoside-diphosphate-sugar epimerase
MLNKPIKVLIVGGAGYIGGAVTDILSRGNIPFVVYDNLLYEHQYLKPVDFIYGDIRDTEKLSSILPSFTHVVWLAAIVGDAACQINPKLTIEINQESVKWLSKNYSGRTIFLSTCSVYGKNDEMVNESSKLNPLSLYAQTKEEAEKYLKQNDSLIFRLGTVFGVADHYSRLRMDLVVNYMTANALTKNKIQVFGGKQWRPIIHVTDVARLIVNNLDKEINGIFNLASHNMQIKELAQIVKKYTGCEVETLGQEFEDKRDYRVDTSKAIKFNLLPLQDPVSAEKGINEVISLIKSNRIKYTENDVYFNERHIKNLFKENKFI